MWHKADISISTGTQLLPFRLFDVVNVVVVVVVVVVGGGGGGGGGGVGGSVVVVVDVVTTRLYPREPVFVVRLNIVASTSSFERLRRRGGGGGEGGREEEGGRGEEGQRGVRTVVVEVVATLLEEEEREKVEVEKEEEEEEEKEEEEEEERRNDVVRVLGSNFCGSSGTLDNSKSDYSTSQEWITIGYWITPAIIDIVWKIFEFGRLQQPPTADAVTAKQLCGVSVDSVIPKIFQVDSSGGKKPSREKESRTRLESSIIAVSKSPRCVGRRRFFGRWRNHWLAKEKGFGVS
ncbi:hypothetical protein V1477_018951 [Vespula maculifrons]|uniref:Uncharacterized protein n=1 Tax=Vespula maculifrons TaxID=7453 RepID=A0ABD2ASW7_VESMC